MRKSGIDSRGFFSSPSLGWALSCWASNSDVGMAAALTLAGCSTLAAAAGMLATEAGAAAAFGLGAGAKAWRTVSAGSNAARGFASPFRKRPLATRNVPLDCSMLIGLVSTRFAPMRNALATPICPSTTATHKEL